MTEPIKLSIKLKPFKITNVENYGHLIVLVGIQGSGKSTYAKEFIDTDSSYKIISRDQYTNQKTVADLIPIIKSELLSGQNIIVDNTTLTTEYQDMYRSLPHKTIKFIYFKTTPEDAQIRVLCRTYDKYNDIPMAPEDIKLSKKNWSRDPHIFPNFIISKSYKELNVPIDATILQTPKAIFPYTGKALFLDIDGTLRKTDHLINKYPTLVSEIEPFADLTLMTKILQKYVDDGYQLIGISNQSGISKGIITQNTVDECMDATRQMFVINGETLTSTQFPIYYCPHKSFPMTCYCRKPYSGLVVKACKIHKINPEKSIFVGDRKTDETCAKRMNIPFVYSDKFFH